MLAYLKERKKQDIPSENYSGPSVPSMLKNEEIQRELEKSTAEKLNRELNRQLARIVGK